MKIKGFIDKSGCPRIPFRSIERGNLSLVVDTGFNGSLCLPKKLIQELSFNYVGTYEIELADGTRMTSRVYAGEILWFRKKTEVLAHETVSQDGLVGTELLRGAYFEMDIDKNLVLITQK